MIVKGNLHGNAPRLAEYQITQAGNERIEIVANRGGMFTGLTVEDVRLSAKEMQMQFEGTNGKYPCYHVQISPGKKESLTPDQVQRTIDIYLKKRGFEERQMFATVHHKKDGMHLHMGISRFNPKTGLLDKNKMWRDDHDWVRGMLEAEFGHAPTPRKNPRRAKIREQMSGLYGRRPQDFVQGVNNLGYALAYGGSRNHPWQLVDSMAVAHNLTSLIHIDAGEGKTKKVTNKQLIDHFRGIRFPTLNEAIALQRVKQENYQKELKRADKEATKAEQFKYSPDTRIKTEVVKLDISKKQDAALAALTRFKNQEAISEKQDGAVESLKYFRKKETAKLAEAFSEQKDDVEKLSEETERARKLKEMQDNLKAIFSRKKKHGPSL